MTHLHSTAVGTGNDNPQSAHASSLMALTTRLFELRVTNRSRSAAEAFYIDEVSSNVRHLPPRGSSASLAYLLVPPNQEASVDIPDDEATSVSPAAEPMLPVTRAAAVASLSLGTGDVGESRRRGAGSSARADHHSKEEVQHYRDDNYRIYLKLKQNSA